MNDFLIGPDGNLTAAVIGVGGFLGIGEKNIAVPYSALQTKMQDNETIVVLNATKAELQAAPDYRDLEDQPLSVSKRLSDEAKETYNDAKEKASKTYEQAKDKASETYNKAKDDTSDKPKTTTQ